MTERAGFREAYARLRHFHERDCRKHGLHPNPEVYTEMQIDKMSMSELLRELDMWADIIDDENGLRADGY